MEIKSKVSSSVFLISIIMLLGMSGNTWSQSALDGKWQTGEDNSVVQVEESNGVVGGKLVSSDNPKAKMGTEILRDFKLSEGVWSGKLYAAKKGKWFDATIKPGTDILNIKVSAGIVSKKVVWKRIEP